MKFSLSLLLLATAAEGFMVPLRKDATRLDAFGSIGAPFTRNTPTPAGTATAKPTTPIIEDKTVPLTGLAKKYRAQDGSVILSHDFRLTMELATIAPLIYYGYHGDANGQMGMLFHLVLSGWLGVQANRVRTVFDKEAIEFYNLKGSGVKYQARPALCDDRLQRKPNNWMVGHTPSRWNYETITGYYFYPSIEFPVVTILWETETTQYGEQPHFFPALFNVKQFKEEMDKHGVPYKLPFVPE